MVYNVMSTNNYFLNVNCQMLKDVDRGSNGNDIETKVERSFHLGFHLLIPELVKIEGKGTLLILHLTKIEAKQILFIPLLPDPARTTGPVQPKKFGCWRKN